MSLVCGNRRIASVISSLSCQYRQCCERGGKPGNLSCGYTFVQDEDAKQSRDDEAHLGDGHQHAGWAQRETTQQK